MGRKQVLTDEERSTRQRERAKQNYENSKCSCGKQKSRCIEHGGNGICPCGKRKERCKEHGGGELCPCGKRNSRCKEHGGGELCPCGKENTFCKEHGGGSLCPCGKKYGDCYNCNPVEYSIKKIISAKLLYIIRNNTTVKKLDDIEFLGCGTDFFLNYLKSKFIEGMTFENVSLDHIKPISKFKFENDDDFLNCCHYTNLQPLSLTQNMEKSNKWSDVDEIFWNENIKGKEYNKIYMPK